MTKLDDHSLKYEGPFGSFTANGTVYSVKNFYLVRPSAHSYTGSSMVMEMNIKGRSASGASATIIILFEVMDDPEYDTFSYTAGIGTDEIKEMRVGQMRNNYDRIDLNLVIPATQNGDQFLHYKGTSLWDSCETTLNIISKVTVIINAAQLNELVDRHSNYQVNPLRIDVFEGKKPDEPPKPQIPDPNDDLIFDPFLYRINYNPYPPTQTPTPPEITIWYPSIYFPYPDTWPWIGEPNYPNDPWYPLYVFPPVPPIQYPNPIIEIPPVLPYNVIYEPIFPDQSPYWPFGYPIWPQVSYPIWPQNADFYPTTTDPYPDTSKPPTISLPPNSSTPQPPFPFKIHPMLPYPFYSYFLPITYYPHFPAEHWPDDVFDPTLYEGYPTYPNNNSPSPNATKPEPPTDPKLHWPQNPYYRWPEVPGYKWPVDTRFQWPKNPEDPKWMWPSQPLLDPKWRQPNVTTDLPKPIGQRRPEDPIIPGKPIPTTPNTTGLYPKEPRDPNEIIPRFYIPSADPVPQPRPGYIFPDPTYLITTPHSKPPFPANDTDLPNVYKGVPNQPLGLIPSLAIPIWVPLNPKIYVIDPRKEPVAPPGMKWIPYFYYPLPHRTRITNRIGVTPQFILVPNWYLPPTSEPVTIPVFIRPPPGVKFEIDPLNPQVPKLIRYDMPVLFKPVDPLIKIKIPRRDIGIITIQVRQDRDKDIDKTNIDNLTPKPPKGNITEEVRPPLLGTPSTPNSTNPPGPNTTTPNQTHPNTTIPPNQTNQTNQTTPPTPPIAPNITIPPPYWPPMNPTTPNGTVVYDDKGKPLREIIGYDDVCDDWRVNVLVNRHFKQAFEWKYQDMELHSEGEYSYCAKWRKVPRFKDFSKDDYLDYLKHNNLTNQSQAVGITPPGQTPGSNNSTTQITLPNGTVISIPSAGNPNGTNGTNGTNATAPSPAEIERAKKMQQLLDDIKKNPNEGVAPPPINVNKIKIEVPCQNELNIVLNDRNYQTPKETKDELGRKCHIWVNNEQEALDYKKRNEELAKALRKNTVKQLAFQQMIRLRFD